MISKEEENLDKNENAKIEIKLDFELEIEIEVEDRDMEDEEILTGFEKAQAASDKHNRRQNPSPTFIKELNKFRNEQNS